jgi:hypothetical protein
MRTILDTNYTNWNEDTKQRVLHPMMKKQFLRKDNKSVVWLTNDLAFSVLMT